MSEIDPGVDGVTPAAEPGAQGKAIPLRTIPHFASPAGATSPVPSVLVDAHRTSYSWSPPERPRTAFVWEPPEDPPAA